MMRQAAFLLLAAAPATVLAGSSLDAVSGRPMPGDHGDDDQVPIIGPLPPPMNVDPGEHVETMESMDGMPHHGHHHHHHGEHGGHGCHMMPMLMLLSLSVLVVFVAMRRVAPRQAFRTPIHGCFSDMPSCLLTTCCPCLAYGKVAEFALGLPWYLMCSLMCCCSNFRCCLGMASRQSLRGKLDIDGHWAEDACIHAFAQPCALCQEVRPIHKQSVVACDFSAGNVSELRFARVIAGPRGRCG